MPSGTVSMARATPNSRGAVILCDDHVAIRAGLRHIFESEGIQVVGDCDTLSDLLNLVGRYPAAVLVVDLGVDGVQFATLVKEVRERSETTAIVVYSMRESASTIALCYQAGAAAYVPKKADVSELVQAVVSASVGGIYIPQPVASDLAAFRQDQNHPQFVLTRREFEVFVAFAKTGTNEHLENTFQLNPQTVRNLLTGISKKLGIPRSRFHAHASSYGLIDEV